MEDIILDKKREFLKELLRAELQTLRAKAKISQEDLSKMIGISRQTYSEIETGKRKMTWNVFLALLLFYDYNTSTHQMIRTLGIFPADGDNIFSDELPI